MTEEEQQEKIGTIKTYFPDRGDLVSLKTDFSFTSKRLLRKFTPF